jgi:hypothetical protein
MLSVRIVLLTTVRLFGEGLALCLDGKDDIVVDALVSDFGALRHALNPATTLALIDVTAGFDLDEIRSIAVDYPALKLVAIGLRERNDQVVLCGQASRPISRTRPRLRRCAIQFWQRRRGGCRCPKTSPAG